MQAEDIRQILIIGAGSMGQQIGFHFAASGFAVNLYDISRGELDKTGQRAGKVARAYVRANRLAPEAADAALERIRPTDDPQMAGEAADFVSESVPEDPDLKGRVFSRFHAICPAHAVFTTNTSSLLPSRFAQQTGRPEKFAALHFHDLRFSTVVDIMPHPGTSAETVAFIEALAAHSCLVPIMICRESPGYVFNAMLMELLKAAQGLAATAVASIEDIDRSWMGVMMTDVGPFGIMDGIGLDTVLQVTEYWAEETGDPRYRKNAEFLRRYVDKGLLGTKTGRGFYSYPHPAYRQPGFLEKKNEEGQK
ncbi:MAG TPA: 3-hydroxyacyl-CoA dehydrogenase [Desulfosalsimonadaceae bacterium]|nr:3-hydroxyacyl-CoA dehydrogenase [Desulfosalsimonadaceae bacterium]